MNIFNDHLHKRINELENILDKILKQSRHTSNSLGKTGYRLFGSDDFTMVYEEALKVLNKM